MSGVEVHANVVATLLDRAFIATPWFLSTPLLLLVVGGTLGAILARCGLELGLLLTAAHHLVWRGLALAAFSFTHWRIETASMLLLGVLVYGTIFAMRWRWIRRMMGMVKSEAVARALEADAKLDLRGQQRDITVLFCDVRNFTTFSEQHSPHEVVRLLNAFFAEVVPVMEAERGTVNSYIGDAVMVIFGAPRGQPDHAVRAVYAAREVLRRVHALDQYWASLGAKDFRIGIGIHTGKAVVGTVGSPRRLDYTAIGDTVNTASRIESANKELQTEALISQAVFAMLPNDEQQRIAALGEPRPLSVKGKQKTLHVYPLVDHGAASTHTYRR
jgi:adenylate cyclase